MAAAAPKNRPNRLGMAETSAKVRTFRETIDHVRLNTWPTRKSLGVKRPAASVMTVPRLGRPPVGASCARAVSGHAAAPPARGSLKLLGPAVPGWQAQ